ncbi:MAG: hypothetical protein HIU91_08275 [Acidobacteria bacterium]|nr:hypothetical protein [Acidobacteriota bacterium]
MTRPTNTSLDGVTAPKPSSIFVIALAWIIVLFPAGWGIYLTALRAARLFRG